MYDATSFGVIGVILSEGEEGVAEGRGGGSSIADFVVVGRVGDTIRCHRRHSVYYWMDLEYY